MTSLGKKLQVSRNVYTTLGKESIVALIKGLFKDEFEKQQQKISQNLFDPISTEYSLIQFAR